MRIAKYFSQQNILSRREAENEISRGNVSVNGEIITNPAHPIDPSKDKIELVHAIQNKTTILYYKPRGISSSKIAQEGTNIFDLHPQFSHLNTIGRLDKESKGLILLSNDGVLTSIITSDQHLIEKTYVVTVREDVTTGKIKLLEKGILLNDGPTLPAKAQKLSRHMFQITLREGRKHQIRRMANKLRFTITELERTKIGFLSVGKLTPNAFRELHQAEIQKLKQLTI